MDASPFWPSKPRVRRPPEEIPGGAKTQARLRSPQLSVEGKIALSQGSQDSERAQRLAILETLALIAPSCGERPVVVARELTKVHETFHTGTAATLAESFAAHPPRGECTVLIGAS